MELITGIVLGICSIVDIYSRKIDANVLKIYAAGAGLGRILECIRAEVWTEPIAAAVLGLVPGLLCLLFSAVTDQQLGYGDGLLLLAVGFAHGAIACMQMIAISLLIVGAWAFFLMLRKRVGPNDSVPFVPFLMAAWIVQQM